MHQWEIIATGRVQGVGFRYHAQALAQRCDIRGFVRNLPDGSVYILAQGARNQLQSFCDLLKLENGFSRVKSLSIDEMEITKEYNDFEIK